MPSAPASSALRADDTARSDDRTAGSDAADPNFNAVPRAGAVAQFWADYCALGGLPATTDYQAWYFGDGPALAHELAELVVRGPKRATANLGWFNDAHPHLAPVPHGYSVVTEFDGTPRAVIRTTQLERVPFHAVDAQFAWDEGEGDRTLPDWLDGHRRYFGRWMTSLGRAFTEDMAVDLERFEVLYPFDAALHPVDCGPRIVPGWLPGAAGTLTALHAQYYAAAHGLGAGFEAKVAAGLAEFLAHFDPARCGLWLLVDAGRIHGGLAIDGRAAGGGAGANGVRSDDAAARLRWFIVADTLRGSGWGARLLAQALRWCRDRQLRRVWLTTFAGLDAARALYERTGFRLTHEAQDNQWGRALREQRFDLELP